MSRPTVYITVPAKTRRSQCRSCDAVIFWIETASGKRMPIDVDIEGGAAPTDEEPGRGVAHFATCDFADVHRKPRVRS